MALTKKCNHVRKECQFIRNDTNWIEIMIELIVAVVIRNCFRSMFVLYRDIFSWHYYYYSVCIVCLYGYVLPFTIYLCTSIKCFCLSFCLGRYHKI